MSAGAALFAATCGGGAAAASDAADATARSVCSTRKLSEWYTHLANAAFSQVSPC